MYAANTQRITSTPRARATTFPADANAPGGPSRSDYLRRAYAEHI